MNTRVISQTTPGETQPALRSIPDESLSRWGVTLLRVSLGVMYLTHGLVLKVLTYGFAGTVGFFTSIGLPAFSAYAVIAAETIGGALILANVRTRWVALGLVPVLVGALFVHAGNGWVFSNQGGGWEYPLFLIVISLVVALQASARAVPATFGRAVVRQVG